MAAEETYTCEQLFSFNIHELIPNPGQPRIYFDPAAFYELTYSIIQHNLLSLIHFRVDNSKYIITGERWSMAARRPGSLLF